MTIRCSLCRAPLGPPSTDGSGSVERTCTGCGATVSQNTALAHGGAGCWCASCNERKP